MEAVYESVSGIVHTLNKRGLLVDANDVAWAMTAADLHFPLGSADLPDLEDILKDKNPPLTRWQNKAKTILSTKGWRESVSRARWELGLPQRGMSQEEARVLHNSWTHHFTSLFAARQARKSFPDAGLEAAEFWRNLIVEARHLCPMLSLDSFHLDNLLEAPGKPRVDILLGLRKLLDPDLEVRIGGQIIVTQPTSNDRVMLHLLCGHDLSSSPLSVGPTMSQWVGRARQTGFRLHDSLPSEVREQRTFLQWINRDCRRVLLVNFPGNRTWKTRSLDWNQLYPDWAFASPDAMRKADGYWRQRLSG